MNLFRHRSLLTKVNLIIACLLVLFFSLAGWFGYRQQRQFVIDEAVEESRILAFAAIRTREYISEQLLLGGVELSQARLGLVPVVASNRIGRRVGDDLDYRVRQVSDRFRNPANAPDPFENEVLRRFRSERGDHEFYAITELEGEPVFRYLQAFTAEKSCLECHGEPASAPAFIAQRYPEVTDHAYGYRLGDVIGAASVVIPMERLSHQVTANLHKDLIGTALILVALVGCLGVLLRVAVTAPLARLGAGIHRVIKSGRFEEKIPRRGRDEIGRLIDGFNDMTDRLRENSRHLEESEKRFRVLTETARDGIISFLANGQIILFNRQAERIFGYSKREVLGVSIRQLLSADCPALKESDVEAYLKRHAGALVREVHTAEGCRRDGETVKVEVSLSVAESEGHLFYTAILREHGERTLPRELPR
ncbi:MAG: hypothetical protein C0621_07725 [Desulfuromonas sp.]|nr:MAG: hypothetical protein C0621_07725 [Desulfuromonas sp.]